MFCQDHEETYPLSTEIWSAIKVDPGVLVCPTKGKNTPNGYIYNGLLSGSGMANGIEDTTGVMPDDIRDELGSFLTMDGTSATGAATNVYTTNADIDLRHSGYYIASFTDGHVSALKAKPRMLSSNMISDVDYTMTSANPFTIQYNNNASMTYPFVLKSSNNAVELIDSSPNNLGSTFRISLDTTKIFTKRVNTIYNLAKNTYPVEFIWTFKAERTKASDKPVNDAFSVEFQGNDGGVNIPRFPVIATNISSYGNGLVNAMKNDETNGSGIEVAETIGPKEASSLRFKVYPNGGAKNVTSVDLQVTVRTDTNGTPEGIAIDDVAVYEITQ